MGYHSVIWSSAVGRDSKMKVVLLTAAAAAILLAYYAEADSQFKACRNRISGCGRRARLGHCKTKKRFMTKNCAKRCGFCGTPKSTAAPTLPQEHQQGVQLKDLPTHQFQEGVATQLCKVSVWLGEWTLLQGRGRGKS